MEQRIKQGDLVKINGSGDLAMTHKAWIGHTVVFEKLCKSGMVLVSRVDNPKETTTVRQRNIDNAGITE